MNEPGPIGAAFERVCRDRAGDEAIVSRRDGERLSFGELAQRVGLWKGPLSREPEGPAALAVGNRPAFVELFFALRARSRPVVLLDEALPRSKKVETCRRLGVRLLLTSEEDGGTPLGAGVGSERVSGLKEISLPGDTALVKLTSGSTGCPVGVCLDEEALAVGIDQIGAGMGLGSDDRVLLTIPLSHSYGFDNGVLSLASLGTPLVLERSFYPRPLLTALAAEGVTVFPAVPPLIRALSEIQWPRELPLREVISAGGPLPREHAARFHRASGRRVHQFYGSTETGGISFEAAPDDPGAAGTVGHPLPGVKVDLTDEGRVRVASRAVFHGYAGGSLHEDRRTVLGDTGEILPDGRLRLTGRAKDLLNVGGRRLSAGAIEAGLRKLPGVEDVAVLSVEDPLRGDAVRVFVVTDGRPVPAASLPRGVPARALRRVESLPYDQRGKLDRRKLLATLDER